ncbi:MAG TPA: hypothetical protein DDX19_21810 [Rhodopirellula baltica]|uniref:Uncharacterized protein n=1 Tax=Rhodopirellula baltica WH47 TaxID=991778 RepID=F2ANN4_RHOBT|nr:hypothetical protein RBWH47_02683 [Rhodopirellula baltica WH47]HBE65344.1 hypothetical protein [Rhodopirellula baltica]
MGTSVPTVFWLLRDTSRRVLCGKLGLNHLSLPTAPTATLSRTAVDRPGEMGIFVWIGRPSSLRDFAGRAHFTLSFQASFDERTERTR